MALNRWLRRRTSWSEQQRQRSPFVAARQQFIAVAIQPVREEREPAPRFLVARGELRHPRLVVDVARPDASVDDAFRARHTAAESERAAAGQS